MKGCMNTSFSLLTLACHGGQLWERKQMKCKVCFVSLWITCSFKHDSHYAWVNAGAASTAKQRTVNPQQAGIDRTYYWHKFKCKQFRNYSDALFPFSGSPAFETAAYFRLRNVHLGLPLCFVTSYKISIYAKSVFYRCEKSTKKDIHIWIHVFVAVT